MTPVGFGVIGARSFVATRAVIPAIRSAPGARLVATASRSAGLGRYEDVLEHPGVEAVYVPLPNGQHRHWVEAAATAGKHVLCEKPLAPSTEDAAAMAAACDAAGVVLAEAWMTPFGPRWAGAVARAAGGALGPVGRIRTRFTFTIGPGNESNYRWDPNEGGGALWDVGIYVLGPAVALWGAGPDEVEAVATIGPTGVDLSTEFTARWPGGRVAEGHASFVDDEAQEIEIVGRDGTITIAGDAHTGDPDADPYREMVAAMSRAVRGVARWPRPPSESIAMLGLIERIAAAAR